MNRDESLNTPPPLPPPGAKRKRKKATFWRTPTGVLAVIGVLLGVLITAVVVTYTIAVEAGYVPDTAAIAGADLSDSIVVLLREHEIVEDDEQVRYYYSAGLFDHLEDGHLISDDRVVWFWRDGEGVENWWLEYSQIEDIRVVWGEGFLDDTIITILDEDGDENEIYVSTDDRNDREYHKLLRKLWKEHR